MILTRYFWLVALVGLFWIRSQRVGSVLPPVFGSVFFLLIWSSERESGPFTIPKLVHSDSSLLLWWLLFDPNMVKILYFRLHRSIGWYLWYCCSTRWFWTLCYWYFGPFICKHYHHHHHLLFSFNIYFLNLTHILFTVDQMFTCHWCLPFSWHDQYAS